MRMLSRTVGLASVVALGLLVADTSAADDAATAGAGAPTPAATATAAQPDPNAPPIPPHVEGAAVAGPGGGYCYVGPHPGDARGGGATAWHDEAGQHVHFYAPVDLRLFSFRNGCYYFVGDPNDFGYRGTAYQYYGAHPVHHNHGGGWCFMIGGHAHWWRPWSQNFVVMGPWFYWGGPYDAFFWSYWPYYSFYYRSFYPRYYGGGRYYRDRVVAPPITRVPAPAAGQHWRGAPPAQATGMPGWRPDRAGSTRGAPLAGAQAPGNVWRATPPAAVPYSGAAPVRRGETWTGTPAWNGPAPGYRPAPSSTFRAAPVPVRGAPPPSFRPGPSFRGSPVRAAPAGGGGRGAWRR